METNSTNIRFATIAYKKKNEFERKIRQFRIVNKKETRNTKQ